MTQKFSAIPTIPEDRLQGIRQRLLFYLFDRGTPPDYACRAADIEKDLELTRDELRAVHMAILTEGLVAERARTGFIGLSEKGQITVRALKEGDD